MDLEQENQRLQRTIATLLQRIEENQKIQQRFQSLEQRLLACTSLSELLDQLLVKAVHQFDLVDISLFIHDPDYSTRDLLQHLGIEEHSGRLQLCHQIESLRDVYPRRPMVTLAAANDINVSPLFSESSRVGSVALLPLERQAKLTGSLHFGSASIERFSADKATDFMAHLGLIVAVCLENCLAREHLKRQGQLDMLTQVSNRRHFEAEYAKELERTQRSGKPLACMFVDVDHFKAVNDTHGHQAGDLCLKSVARQIQQQLRKTDLLARYGGEEFVVLLPSCDAREAGVIAERVRSAVAASSVRIARQGSGDAVIEITASIGVSHWLPQVKREVDLQSLGEALIKAADEAMYSAKQQGRNRVREQCFS